jgi:hypothetical protein
LEAEKAAYVARRSRIFSSSSVCRDFESIVCAV